MRYDADTGLLYWLPRTKWTAEHVCAIWNSKHAGKEAFTAISLLGYRFGCIDGRVYMAARIIWKLVHGYDPIERTIDWSICVKLTGR